MKRILLYVILLGLCFGLSGCGSNKGEEKTLENNKESVSKYADLSMNRRIGVIDDAWVSLPSWREDGSETCTVVENLNYYILAVISKEDYSFEELFNNEVKSSLKHFVDRGTYENFVPDNKSEVTLDNGIKAVKFEGTLSMDSYGDIYNYPTYGYYFKYKDYPVMVMSVETEKGGKDLNNDDERNKTNKYVDEIVETIREHE